MACFLVLGCGSIGSRHIENLSALGQEIYCYDKDFQKLETACNKYHVHAHNWTSQHIPLDAVVICTPPELHMPFAFEAVKRNLHVFIEKPISDRLTTGDGSVEELVVLARQKDLVLTVGYQLRYASGLQKLKEIIDNKTFGDLIHIYAEYGMYLGDWHPLEDYRLGYTAYTGIILDSSHELDYVMWLAGSKVIEVKSMISNLNPLGILAESCADILLRFENGITANVHVDMLQREQDRRCKVIMERREMPFRFTAQREDLYLKEIQHFLDCIAGKSQPLVTGEDALEVLKVALKAKGG